jgi:hypothetical protein
MFESQPDLMLRLTCLYATTGTANNQEKNVTALFFFLLPARWASHDVTCFITMSSSHVRVVTPEDTDDSIAPLCRPPYVEMRNATRKTRLPTASVRARLSLRKGVTLISPSVPARGRLVGAVAV